MHFCSLWEGMSITLSQILRFFFFYFIIFCTYILIPGKLCVQIPYKNEPHNHLLRYLQTLSVSLGENDVNKITILDAAQKN